MGKKYIIDEDLLLMFIESDKELTALNYGGVDNWEWYGESLRIYRKEKYPDAYDYDEVAEMHLKKLVENNKIVEHIEE